MSANATSRRRYAGRTPEQRRADQQTRLREAGLALFGVLGYPATGIQALCAEAHVTARHFYQLYPSTESLFREVYDDISGSCLVAIIKALDQAGDPALSVRRGVHAAVTYLLSDPRRARVQCIESYTVSPAFLTHRHAVLTRFAGVLAVEALKKGRVPLTDTQLNITCCALISAADSILAAHVRDPLSVSVKDCEASLTYLMLSAAGLAPLAKSTPRSQR